MFCYVCSRKSPCSARAAGDDSDCVVCTRRRPVSIVVVIAIVADAVCEQQRCGCVYYAACAAARRRSARRSKCARLLIFVVYKIFYARAEFQFLIIICDKLLSFDRARRYDAHCGGRASRRPGALVGAVHGDYRARRTPPPAAATVARARAAVDDATRCTGDTGLRDDSAAAQCDDIDVIDNDDDERWRWRVG